MPLPTTSRTRSIALLICTLFATLCLTSAAAAQQAAPSTPSAEPRQEQKCYIIRYYFLSFDKDVQFSDARIPNFIQPTFTVAEFDAKMKALENKDPDKTKYRIWGAGFGLAKAGEQFVREHDGGGYSEEVRITPEKHGEGARLVWLDIHAQRSEQLAVFHFNWTVNHRIGVADGRVILFGGFKGDEEFDRKVTKARRKGLRPQLLYFAVSVEETELQSPAR